MIEVEALDSFAHSGTRNRGDRFKVSERAASELERKGLVAIVKVDGKGPSQADGKPLSASPAAQASPQTTAKKSGGGGKKKSRSKAAPEG